MTTTHFNDPPNGGSATAVADLPSPRQATAGDEADVGGRRFRVLVVDDHEVVHWGFRLLLTSESWVQRYLAARDPDEALILARRYQPHVALIDMFIGEDSGVELCERLHEVSPGTHVLLMSGVGRVPIRSVRSSGALGFVPKAWGAKDIARAARMVGLGMTFSAPVAEQPASMLSDREWGVLRLLADGATNREIAAKLYLSPHTVKDHTRSLYRKVKARNRAEAIVRAQRLGLIG